MSNAFPAEGASVPRASLYYRHSGKAPPVSVIVALIGGAVAALPAAMLYALGDVYIPLFYIKFLLGMGLGFVLGGAPASMLRLVKVRSNFVSAIVVAAVAAIGYYAVWVSWIWVLFKRSSFPVELTTLFSHPRLIWKLTLLFNTDGTWSFEHSSDKVSGVFLWLIWAAEAVLIFAFAKIVAGKIITATPFCETCGVWCGKPRRLGTTPVRDIKELRRKLEAAEFESVGPVSPTVPNAGQWLSYLHHTCPTCGQLNTLSVQKVTLTQNRKSKKARNVVKTIIDKLLLHPGEADLLLPAPPAPPAETTSD